ncbi:MAG: metalloregulator ArsR/SmtB family transcription factor [Candidatus Micrarchaeia archaeon]
MKHKDDVRFLKAMADETRFNILALLLDGKKCVCEIFPKVKRTQSSVSFQLSKLELAGILESHREGQKVFYQIKDYRVCDVFKALGHKKGTCLKSKCCMAE